MHTKTLFYSDNRGIRCHKRKRAKGGGGRHRNDGDTHIRSNSHLAQPMPSQEGTEPCPLCGFPVDPKRLHFHMVRVHGATLRQKGG